MSIPGSSTRRTAGSRGTVNGENQPRGVGRPSVGDTPPLLPDLLTVPDVAQVLRKTDAAVYAMKRRGELPGVVMLGRSVRVDRAELVEWLRHKSSAVTAERVA